MTVYFIKSSTDNSRVKIGHSKNVKKRFKQIQYMSPAKLEIMNTMDGDAQTEMNIHQMFGGDRLYGEWFTLTPKLVEFIQSPFNPMEQRKNSEGNFRIIRSPECEFERNIIDALFSEDDRLPVCKECNNAFLVVARRPLNDQWEYEYYINGEAPNFCPMCGELLPGKVQK